MDKESGCYNNMDILDLRLANEFATRVAAGFSKVEVDGMNIIFTLNNGATTTLTVPTPADGVSVVDLNIDEDGSLICTMSDGTTIDAGGVPFVKPERGIDYWTPEDQAAINTYIEDRISNAYSIDTDEITKTLIFKRTGSAYSDEIADISSSLDNISGEVI